MKLRLLATPRGRASRQTTHRFSRTTVLWKATKQIITGQSESKPATQQVIKQIIRKVVRSCLASLTRTFHRHGRACPGHPRLSRAKAKRHLEGARHIPAQAGLQRRGYEC